MSFSCWKASLLVLRPDLDKIIIPSLKNSMPLEQTDVEKKLFSFLMDTYRSTSTIGRLDTN